MSIRRLLALIFFGLGVSISSSAQQDIRSLKQIEAYIAEPAKIVNDVGFQSYQLVKQGLKGEGLAIPKGWRLVSVVFDTSGASKVREFILFFQDAKGAVHTLGVQMSGAVSGSNILTIPTVD